jgi:hypothetical protein
MNKPKNETTTKNSVLELRKMEVDDGIEIGSGQTFQLSHDVLTSHVPVSSPFYLIGREESLQQSAPRSEEAAVTLGKFLLNFLS